MKRVLMILTAGAFLASCSSKGDFECECTEVTTDNNTGEVSQNTYVWYSQNDVEEEDFEAGCDETYSFEFAGVLTEETCVTKEI